MRISFLLCGKTDAAYLKEGMAIYEKRLKHYTKFDTIILPELKNTKHMNAATIKQKEGENILKQIDAKDFVWLLDENGKTFDSRGFAAQIERLQLNSWKRVVIVVGGAYGFSDAVYARAQSKLSLSKMTFSHQLVRLVFLEQLYRAYTILNNEPYHHD